jgi:hypothetical protein
MEETQVRYQQGDVILTKVDNVPTSQYNTVDCNNKVVVAEGEGTGHHHRFELDKLAPEVSVQGWKKRWDQFPTMVQISGGYATLYHEEHNPINLPGGVYRITFVREMDHIAGRERRVVD